MIGRKEETRELEELYKSGYAEFVAVYGRRRVGKTFLIDETFQGRFAFTHAGLSPLEAKVLSDDERRSRMKEQLIYFHDSLLDQGSKASEPPESWLDAFSMLEKLLSSKDDGSRQVVFIDEIQWLDTPRSKFITGLEAFWNGWACHRRNIMLIVCGSSTSWVMDKLIHNHGGLYGRITHQIRLLPFDLSECEEYLLSIGIGMSRYDTARAYMALGGIPYYLRYIKRGLGLIQSINSMFFEGNAPLGREFDDLFSSSFSNPEPMKKIVKTLHTKRRGLSRQELIHESGIQDSGNLSLMLESLIEGGFVFRYVPFGEGRREAQYKLIDPFCIFYLDFVERGADGKNRKRDLGTQRAATWRGLAFENLCFNHIHQIKAAMSIGGVSSEESLWSKKGDEASQGTQIDLIIDRSDNVIDICEAKFLGDEFAVDRDYHLVLERRKRMIEDLVPKKATVRNVLITTYGLNQNEYRWDFAAVLTLDDLFKSRFVRAACYKFLESVVFIDSRNL